MCRPSIVESEEGRIMVLSEREGGLVYVGGVLEVVVYLLADAVAGVVYGDMAAIHVFDLDFL